MLVQITTAGVSAFSGSAGSLILAKYRLGNGVAYVPTPHQTSLVGAIQHEGVPTEPVADTPSLLRYSILLDYEAGPFSYGEVGLYTADDTLVAVAVLDTLITKDQQSGLAQGESQRLDLYIASVGATYSAWLSTAESSSNFRMAVLSNVDALPPALGAVPNAYLISAQSADQGSFIAFTDRAGLWEFSAYGRLSSTLATIAAKSRVSITIPLSDWRTEYDPAYLGKTILQFSSGALLGTCRTVATATLTADEHYVTLGLEAPLDVLPVLGGTVRILVRNAITVANVIVPMATSDSLGAIKIGPSLTVGLDGTLNVDPASAEVHSVAGRTGYVTLRAADIAGLHAVATSGDYFDLANIPAPLTLASDTNLGGVKISLDGYLSITGAGVLDLNIVPVESVNGAVPDASGLVVLPPNEVNFNGDVVGSMVLDANGATVDVDMTLQLSGVEEGTYGSSSGIPVFSVDRKGRVLTVYEEPISMATLGGVPASTLAVPEGVATLGLDGKLLSSQIPSSLLGGSAYLGTWDAATNTPTIVSGVGEAGHYYRVGVTGSTLVDGVSAWSAGDTVIFNGTVWEQVPSEVVSVSSVAGKSGVVTLVKADVGLGSVDNTADMDKPVSVAQAGAISTAQTAAAADATSKANAAIATAEAASTPIAHIGAGDGAHAVATPTVAGFMSASDKLKLDNLSANASLGFLLQQAGII